MHLLLIAGFLGSGKTTPTINLSRAADWLVSTKADVASAQEVAAARRIAAELNPNAHLVALNARDPLDPALAEEWLP